MIKGKLTPQELSDYLRVHCNDGEAWLLICTVLFDLHAAVKDLQNQLGLNEPVEEVQETKRKR